MGGTVRVLLAAAPAANLPDGNRLAAAPAANLPDGNHPAADPAGSPLDGSLPAADPLEKANPVAVRAVIMAWARSPANPAPDKIRGLVILRESGEQSWREDPGGQAERQESPGPPGG